MAGGSTSQDMAEKSQDDDFMHSAAEKVLETISSVRGMQTTGQRAQVDQSWSKPRQIFGLIFNSLLFDIALGAVVLFNVVVLINETDATAGNVDSTLDAETEVPSWCTVANQFLMGVYITELILRLYVFRREFFNSPANIFDMAIILTDLALEVLFPAFLPDTGVLRMFRLLRLGRAAKILTIFPELAMMVQGMAGALRSICWGMLLIVSALTMWSVMAVQLIHPLNLKIAEETSVYHGCERCPRAFESTFASLLTFTQQIVAGDSWGTVCVPIIERHPWTFGFFMAVMSTVGMGIMNLILAVIVDNSLEARKGSDQALAIAKEDTFKRAAEQLERICSSLDVDQDGVISLPEILKGYRDNAEFRACMKVMDVKERDIEIVFNILDADHSGDCVYGEFVEELYRFKSDDSHTLMAFTKYYVQENYQRVTQILRLVEDEVCVILKESADTIGKLASPDKQKDSFEEASSSLGRNDSDKLVDEASSTKLEAKSKAFLSQDHLALLRNLGEAAPALAEAAAAVKAAARLDPLQMHAGSTYASWQPHKDSAQYSASPHPAHVAFRQPIRIGVEVNGGGPSMTSASSADGSTRSPMKGASWSGADWTDSREHDEDDLGPQFAAKSAELLRRNSGSSAAEKDSRGSSHGSAHPARIRQDSRGASQQDTRIAQAGA